MIQGGNELISELIQAAQRLVSVAEGIGISILSILNKIDGGRYKINTLLNYAGLYEEYQKAGLARTRHFNEEHFAKSIEEIFIDTTT